MKTWLLILFVLVPTVASAQIYQWKDSNGKTHFTDSIHNIPKSFRVNLRVQQPYNVPRQDIPALKETLSGKKIKLYRLGQQLEQAERRVEDLMEIMEVERELKEFQDEMRFRHLHPSR